MNLTDKQLWAIRGSVRKTTWFQRRGARPYAHDSLEYHNALLDALETLNEEIKRRQALEDEESEA